MALQRTPPDSGGGVPVTSDLAGGRLGTLAQPSPGSAAAPTSPSTAGVISRADPLPGEHRTVPVRDAIAAYGYERFTNKELSRLDFLSRLLDLAEDTRLPLLEQVKFMAIFSEALDEFFQVRVAGLQD